VGSNPAGLTSKIRHFSLGRGSPKTGRGAFGEPGGPAPRFRLAKNFPCSIGAYLTCDALSTGQSNGRKAASPVREMSCLGASPRRHMRRVPRERLSLVHQRQPDTGAGEATPTPMARAAATTTASTVTGGYSPSTCRQWHAYAQRRCARCTVPAMHVHALSRLAEVLRAFGGLWEFDEGILERVLTVARRQVDHAIGTKGFLAPPLRLGAPFKQELCSAVLAFPV
jgi:hypothetical protein